MRWIVLSTAMYVFVSGCGTTTPEPPRESKCGPSTGTVADVIDGDTLTLRSGVKIRYLLVDSTEITAGKNECYGAEARDFNTTLVEGKQISLTYDEAECQDRFGRTLAYVKVGDTDVNKLLIERGMGCVLYIPPAGGSRQDEFSAAEAQAKRDNRGVWGACSPVPCD